MAMKDWKQTRTNLYFANDIYNWKNQKTHQKILFGSEHSEYYISIWNNTSSSIYNAMVTRQFRTKAQALAYAKAYMRKH